MTKILFAMLMLFLTTSGPIRLAPALPERPHFDVTFCNFPLPASLKQANASFYVTYSFTIDEAGKPSNITKIRNDYVDQKAITSCLEEWNFSGVQKGTTIAAIFRWEHAQGWVDLSITGAGLDQKIRLTGDRCPYSVPKAKSRT